MSKKQVRESSSKRQVLKEQRLKKQRQQRMTVIFGIGAVALLVAGLIIIPPIINARSPVGEIIEITPKTLPQADGTTLGDPDAPVLVEVYEDFQCPACRSYSEQIEPQIIANDVATGKVRYVFRHYPFLDDRSVSKESDQAANASMCANEQGRFWDYKDMLFANWNGENQGAFNDKRLVAYAESLDLDMNAFNTCFKANRFQDKIQEDTQAGTQAGVTGTPTVFVNGKIVSPGFVPSYEEIQAAIETAFASEQ